MTYMVNTNLFNKSKYKAHTIKVNTKIDYKCDTNSCTSGRTNQHLSLVFFFIFKQSRWYHLRQSFFCNTSVWNHIIITYYKVYLEYKTIKHLPNNLFWSSLVLHSIRQLHAHTDNRLHSQLNYLVVLQSEVCQ